MSTATVTVVPNHFLDPWFDSEEKKSLQRLGRGTADVAKEELQPALDQLQLQINDLAQDPVPFRFVASAGQTNFQIDGVYAEQSELILVHRNGQYLHPQNDYTVTATLSPERTTITLATPANLNDVIAGVVYNIVTVQGAGTGGATGGATDLDGLLDVQILNPLNGQVLKYNASLQRWVNEADATGGAGAATNLSFTRNATTVTVESDTGLDAVLPSASTTEAGVMVAADKTKLNGIQAGATQNATDAALRDRSTHTGTQAPSTISMATVRLLGRSTPGTGGAEEIQIGTNLTLTAGVLSAQGGGTPDFVIQSFGVI